MEEFLNEREVKEIQKFLDNIVLQEAVKKVLLSSIYHDGTLKKDIPANYMTNFAFSLVTNNPAVTNAQIGEDLRSACEGVRCLEIGFKKLLEYKKQDEPKEKSLNPAR